MSPTATERSAAGFALAAYTAPVRAELRRWRRQGLSLRQMAARMPTLRFNTPALATLLHHTYAAALLPPADAREAEADAALLTLDALDSLLQSRAAAPTHAANPYGCNQHRHGEGCTHYTGQPNRNELQHEQQHEHPHTRPAERPARPRHLLRQGGESDRADEQGRDPRERPGAGVQPARPEMHKDSGGEPQEVGRVGSQWRLDAVADRVARAAPEGASEESIRECAEIATAQLNAVWSGRKPAFLETNPDLVRPFAQDLPQGLRYVEVGHSACIYHEAAAARELGVPAGEELHEAVRTAVESGDCGLLLGYGAPSISTRPSHGVSIMRNGVEYYGFNSSADRSTAEHYARERMRDFSDAFPKDMWDFDMEKRPGSDGVHAAAYDYRAYVPSLAPDATYRTAAEWAELEPEARVGKFFSARVEDERLLLALQDLAARCLAEGVSEAEFIHRATLLLENLPRPDGQGAYYDPASRMEMSYKERIAYANDVRHIDSRARLKLIYRTQSEMAAGYREWRRGLERLERYPAWRFVRQPGARIKRPDHEEHEDEVRLITDTAYWLARNSPDQGGFNVPYPPFGYNSWMRVEPVSRKEAEKLGLLKKGEKLSIPPEMALYDMRAAVEQSNTASMDGLPDDARQRVTDACREAGIELLPAEGGSTRALPVAPAPIADDDPDLMLEILELLEQLEAVDDDVFAANPYGCNQHRHGEGCPHADGGVDPDLKKNLEAALRRARREDGTVEQGGELSRTHEVRLREMPEVMKALGEPDVPLVMTVHHIRKLASKHGLTVEQMQEVAAKLNDPLLVMHADVQKHLMLLDMEAYEKQDKAMRPVICFVEKKPDKEHAEYVVSAYPLQKEKYRKVTGQVKSLLYSKFRDEKTAQFAADAPQCSEARDLLRAAIRSGFADSVLTGEDLVKLKKEKA